MTGNNVGITSIGRGCIYYSLRLIIPFTIYEFSTLLAYSQHVPSSMHHLSNGKNDHMILVDRKLSLLILSGLNWLATQLLRQLLCKKPPVQAALRVRLGLIHQGCSLGLD
jgi:hypothetical protein